MGEHYVEGQESLASMGKIKFRESWIKTKYPAYAEGTLSRYHDVKILNAFKQTVVIQIGTSEKKNGASS